MYNPTHPSSRQCTDKIHWPHTSLMLYGMKSCCVQFSCSAVPVFWLEILGWEGNSGLWDSFGWKFWGGREILGCEIAAGPLNNPGKTGRQAPHIQICKRRTRSSRARIWDVISLKSFCLNQVYLLQFLSACPAPEMSQMGEQTWFLLKLLCDQ